jgi:type I restriction enzyme S subunit
MSLKKIKQLFNIEKGVLQSSKCIEGEYDFITAAADWKTHNEYTHDCEALIFAAAASGSLGRTHYVNGKFISSDLCFILTPKEPEKLPVNLRFYHIIFNLYKNEIVAATKAGTSKEAIGLRVFGEYELPYFDISIQQKVKAEFGKAEALKNDLFDEYTYQLTLLENLNQAILQEAVQGKLVPQDPKDEPASELLKRIKAEKATLRQAQGKGKKEKPLPPIKPEEIPFEIPENWVWCRLGEICVINGGYAFKSTDYLSEGYRVIRISDFDPYGFIDNSIVRHSYNDKLNSFLLDKEDILLAMTGGTVGKSLYVESIPEPMLVNQRVATIKTTNSFLAPKYIDTVIKSWITQKVIHERKNSTNDNISMDDIKGFLIPLPPLSEQKRIVAEIEKQLAKTKQLKEHIIANQQATEQLLKALLHQAFEVEEMKEVNS